MQIEAKAGRPPFSFSCIRFLFLNSFFVGMATVALKGTSLWQEHDQSPTGTNARPPGTATEDCSVDESKKLSPNMSRFCSWEFHHMDTHINSFFLLWSRTSPRRVPLVVTWSRWKVGSGDEREVESPGSESRDGDETSKNLVLRYDDCVLCGYWVLGDYLWYECRFLNIIWNLDVRYSPGDTIDSWKWVQIWLIK